MQQQDRLARGGRALERRGSDPDDYPSAAEGWQNITEGERSFHCVELVSRLDESRCGSGVEVGAQGDDHHICFEMPDVRLDASRYRIDGADGRPHKAHTGLHDAGVGVANLMDGTPEHHVELGEAEHEPIGLVDQHDLDVVAELLGESRRQLQAAKPGTQHQDSHLLTPIQPT